jgi:hypothetical protein
MVIIWSLGRSVVTLRALQRMYKPLSPLEAWCIRDSVGVLPIHEMCSYTFPITQLDLLA